MSSTFQTRDVVAKKKEVKSESEVAQSCPTLWDPMDTRHLRPWGFLGKSPGVGYHFLLEGSNPGLLHCRQTLYHLSHQGSQERSIYIEIKRYSLILKWDGIPSLETQGWPKRPVHRQEESDEGRQEGQEGDWRWGQVRRNKLNCDLQLLRDVILAVTELTECCQYLW